ncbi:50S ribosomal protein L22 [Candidatus Collierbacteria bacterium]|nr:50S ribosomal protein L22 [Candidatus Collierbacteria bacterium]
MIITAKATNLGSTPRKVNLVLKSIVGMTPDQALTSLSFTPKRAAGLVAKVIKQAIANANNNFKVGQVVLKIDSAFATKGRTIKKGHQAARGRFKPIEKVASHVTINLKVQTPNKPKLSK